MKSFTLPKELQKLNTEMTALEMLMERCAGKFSYKKALKIAIKAKEIKNEFWRKVYLLYPVVEKQGATYDPAVNKIKLHEVEK